MTPGFTMIDNAMIECLPEIGLAAGGVYLVLRRRCNGDGVCWPSVPTIAQDVGVTGRTVRAALQRLVAAGLLEIERQRDRRGLKTANRYRVLPPIPRMQPEANNSTTGKKRPSRPEKNDPSDRKQMTGEQYPIEEQHPTEQYQSSCRKLRFDQADHEMASWMFGLIQAINPGHKQPNLDQWANDIRLMRERDQRTEADIRATFSWANQDDFWRTNILSPAKLREKFDQLNLKRNVGGNRHARKDGFPCGSGQRHSGDIAKAGVF